MALFVKIEDRRKRTEETLTSHFNLQLLKEKTMQEDIEN